MPKVSVIIPTCNRPELLSRAIKSVLNQTFRDFEIIVVDDGDVKLAKDVVGQFNLEEARPFSPLSFPRRRESSVSNGVIDSRFRGDDNRGSGNDSMKHEAGDDERCLSNVGDRIKYIKHAERKGGAAARNTGIKAARGEFIAFLDDDDEWLPEKLEIQMKQFENTPADVGFCLSAVKTVYDNKEELSEAPEGIADYHELALRRMKGFLTVTLIIKKYVFDEVGVFDESLPSHQDPDLIIRVSKKYKGLSISRPLVRVSMACPYEHIGGSLKRRVAGREIIIKKYFDEFKKRPEVLAYHYFQLGLWCRDDGQKNKAKEYFKKAWQVNFNFRYVFHYFRIFMVARKTYSSC